MGTSVDTFSDTFHVRKPTSRDTFGHVLVRREPCRDKVDITTDSSPFGATSRLPETGFSIRMWDNWNNSDSWLESMPIWRDIDGRG